MTQTIDATHVGSQGRRGRERSEWATFTIVGVTALILLAWGPVNTADSGSYLQHTPLRPPAYPTYLALCRLLFGESQFLRASVGIQVALGLLAGARLSRLIGEVLGAPSQVAVFGIWAVLSVGELYFGRAISSEGMAYAFFLAWVAMFVETARATTLRSLFSLGGLTLLLLLQRAQFLFVLPVTVLGVIALGFVRGRRTFVSAVCVFAGVLTLHQGASRLYCYVVSGSSSTPSALGVQLLTITTYLTEPSDVDALVDPTERSFFRAAREVAQQNGNLASQRHEGVPTFADVNAAYNPTCWIALIATYDRTILSRPPPSYSVTTLTTLTTPSEWQTMNGFFTGLSLHLLRKAWPRYARYLVTVLLEQYKYFAFIVTGMLVVAIARAKRDPMFGVLTALVPVLWMTNYVLVEAVEVPMGRYLFYTDGLVAAVLIALMASRLGDLGSRSPLAMPEARD